MSSEIQLLLREQRWHDAAEALSRWTRKHPRHAPGWWWRARCLEHLGQLPSALDCARTALALQPDDQRLEALVARLEAGMSNAEEPDRTLLQPQDGEEHEPDHTLREAATGGAETSPEATEHEAGGTAAAPQVDATAVEHTPQVVGTGGAQQWTIGDVIEGRYEVRSRARGGMGEVYFVIDRELGLEVAVKTPLPSALATAAGRARFLREAEAWIALGLHPNIVTAYYVRDIGSLPRLFIEYIDGGTLEQWLSSHRGAELGQRLDLAIQIAAGMDHAHTFQWIDDDGHEQRGLVHRDLKPANVLVGTDGTARVTDFGLVGSGAFDPDPPAGPAPAMLDGPTEGTLVELGAGATRSASVWGTVTLGGRVMGSPPYMAPEQWEGAHAAGQPADIYAFGCVLHELVCSRRPFTPGPRFANASRALQLKAWEQLHRQQEPTDPRRLVNDLDPELASLILRCLAKEPDRRPASFATLAIALRAGYVRHTGREYPRSAPRTGELLADSLCNRGVSYASLGHADRASAAWRQSLESEPQHVPASFNLALTEWRSGDASDAELIRRVDAAIGTGSAPWRERLLLGRAHLCAGAYAKAVECLRGAAADSSQSGEALKDLIIACAALAGEGDDQELWSEVSALVDRADRWLTLDPTVATCAARARQQLGDDAAGERLWAAARQRLPDPPGTLRAGVERLVPGATVSRSPAAIAGRISAFAVGPDGRVGVVGGEDGRLVVWQPAAGPTGRVLRRGGPGVRCAAVAPGGEVALTACGNDAVEVWNLVTGGVRRNLQAHTGFINALAVDDAATTAAGAGSAGSIFVWDLEGGQRCLADAAHSGFVQCLALAADASLVVSGGRDGKVCALVTAEPGSARKWSAHPGGVSALALDASARWLASGGVDGTLKVWDLAEQRCVTTLRGHAGAVSLVALDLDRQRALSASDDETVRVWDLANASLLKVERVGAAVTAGAATADLRTAFVAHGGSLSQLHLTETPRYEPVWAVAATVSASEADRRTREFREHLAAGRRLLEQQDYASAFTMIDRARNVDGYERAREALELEVELASTFPRSSLRACWPEHELGTAASRLTAMAVSPVGQRALTADRGRQLVVWHWVHGTELVATTAPAVAVAAAFVGSARAAVTAHLDNVIRFWDLDAGVCTLQAAGGETRTLDLAVDPWGSVVVAALADGGVIVMEASSGATRHLLRAHLSAATAVTVRADGRAAVTGGHDGSLLVWDLDSGQTLGQLGGHGAEIVALSWSADGRTVLSASKDHTVRLWEAGAGRCLRTLELDTVPTSLSMSGDGRHALVGDADGGLGMWSLRDRRLVAPLEAHLGSITAAIFTPGDRRVVSAGRDGSARVSYLDWQPRVRPYAEWDEAVRPHIELFLGRHTPPGAPGRVRPEWHEGDERRLLSGLRDAGLGWVRPDGVRQHLADLSAEFRGPDRPRLAAASTSTSVARTARRSWLLRAMVAAVVAVPLLFALVMLLDWRQLHLEPGVAKERRDRDLLARHGPAQIARPTTCDPAQLDRYIRDFVEFTDRPGDWVTANYCLPQLADPRAVAPLLDMLRPQPPDPLVQELQIGSDPRTVMAQLRTAMTGGFNTKASVQSMLARFGDPAIPNLVRALGDREQLVRLTAARALALGDSFASHRSLVEQASDTRPSVRHAVASQIESIACSRAIELEEALEVADRLTRDPDTGVRREVARRAGIFAGSRGRALLTALAEDQDPEVSAAARQHLATSR